MSPDRFLVNQSLWSELQALTQRRGRVRAAVAYFGAGGAKLLPLKPGDELLTDMSLRTVRQGATDPREIRKLIRRGVRVWTRGGLHSKFYVTTKAVIAGSANVSSNAIHRLDEAAIFTADPAAVRRAMAEFARMCTEPVRPKYLEKCLRAYRAPTFVPGTPASRKGLPAKLWYLGQVRLLNLSEADDEILERADVKALKRLGRSAQTQIAWVRFRVRPAYSRNIRVGNWVVYRTVENNGRPHVGPPAQVLGFDTVRSARGARFHRILLEAVATPEEMPWDRFCRRLAPQASIHRLRAGPIADDTIADTILGLWSTTGRARR